MNTETDQLSHTCTLANVDDNTAFTLTNIDDVAFSSISTMQGECSSHQSDRLSELFSHDSVPTKNIAELNLIPPLLGSIENMPDFTENASNSFSGLPYMEDEEYVDDSDKDKDYATESSDESSDDELISKQKKYHGKENKTSNSESSAKKMIGEKTKSVNLYKRDITKERKRGLKGETREVRQKRKEMRNLGKEYLSSKNKIVRERKCKDLRECRLRCNEKLNAETRQKLFAEYWSMGSYNKRVAYISALVTTKEKQTTRTKVADKVHKNRSVSHTYHIRVNGEMVKVCKECFLRTFDETNKFLTNALIKKQSSVSGITNDDLRGKGKPYNKLPDAALELVRNHIRAIPCYESHYCRKQTQNKFLPSHYTLTRIYSEYKKWIPENETPVSRRLYETIFHDMGIKIKSPKKDSCSKCDKLNMEIKNTADVESREVLENTLKRHQLDAEYAYESKRNDKEEALSDVSKSVYTFDLQQCLPTPDMHTSVVFYKRQLWTYNLTMHRCEDKQVFCYMWDESTAGRGANQIASCLYQHFENLRLGTKNITLYSDTCAGQNKNSYLPIMYMLVLRKQKSLSYIEHKFLEPGHTHMECDTDHSIIEKKKKKYASPIDHPRDWMQLVRVCGTKSPFRVIEMKREDFYEFSALLKTYFLQRKVNEAGEKVSWKDIKWLRFSSESFGVMQYKTSLQKEEPFKQIDFRRKRKLSPLLKIIPPLSYKGPIPINPEKKANLLSLLPYIDKNFHAFYENLVTKDDIPNILPETDEECSADED